MIEDVIVIIQYNLNVDVVDNDAIFGTTFESMIASIKSKKEAKYINIVILGQLSALFNSFFLLANL